MDRRFNIKDINVALKPAANKARGGTREDCSGHYQRVQSSMMTSVRYDSDARELQITFISGKTYRYSNVPLQIYIGQRDAGSKGEYFNAHIKGAFAFAEI